MKLLDDDTGLFVRLYRLAHRQQENFTTEAFVHTLRELAAAQPEAAVDFLDWLTDSDMFSSRTDDSKVAIRSQAYTDEHGIPDIRIEADDLDVIIEVKLDAGLTFAQADIYREHLDHVGAERRCLVALLGGHPTESLPPGTVTRTWGELGQRLLKQTQGADSEVPRHLVEQLVGLLNHLHLMPLRVRSRLSESLKAHQQWSRENPELPSLSRTRVRSVARLQEMTHCEPLRNLLLQMERVLERHPEVHTFFLDSSAFGVEPWIGFNVNNMDYFFYLPINDPEQITLQRLRGGVDRASFDGSLGYLEDSRKDGIVRWRTALDLAGDDSNYFDADRTEQLRLLTAFFDRGLAYAQTLDPQTDLS